MSSDNTSAPPPGRLPVVGIGASAGGLEACIEFLKALPARTGMGFVLVQHLEPHHESHLPEILSRATSMPVVQATEGMKVEPDHMYVVPPNVVLGIKNGTLNLSPRSESLQPYLPIDQFFFSLAEDKGSDAIGVILSGSSSDGTQGLLAIKCAAGTTFSQSEESARYSRMPRSAIAAGDVDFVLSPEELAREVARVGSYPLSLQTDHLSDSSATSDETLAKQDLADFQRILSLLRSATNVDFSQYKKSTIRRRIARRMLIHNLPEIHEYVEFLENNPDSLNDLYRDLLISVTQFFREPAMFTSLAQVELRVLPKRDRAGPFRMWIAGCATGEEAYSMAILMLETLEAAGHPLSIQLFGTDISEAAIEKARAAVYPDSIERDVSPQRLSRFFTRVEGGYRIAKSIRECCIFARHDLVRDPPFSQLDLVSCRNVLIYLGASAQQHVLSSFHYCLKRDGILVLGGAESVGSQGDLFDAEDADNKIFCRRLTANRYAITMADPPGLAASLNSQKLNHAGVEPTLIQVEARASRILQDIYAPPGVTINDALQIVHFHGQTVPYLQSPPGEASLNILRVAHPSLLFPLRKAIDEACEKKQTVYERGIRFEHDGQSRDLTLRVMPIPEGSLRFYLVLFEDDLVPHSEHGQSHGDGDSNSRSFELELGHARRQLDEARLYLRRIIEQNEVAMEELRAAHEEVQSSNEEMQSTNEELRTAKEELQSSNEELITVNDELNNRNSELASANNDLSNVLNAVSIPIIMVGMDFRIRRYTPSASRLLNTVSTDLGRLLTDVIYNMEVPGMKEMLTEAIHTLVVQKTQVRSRDGRWYSVQVGPYRTIDNRIDGAVITFIDIDEVTRALERAEAARNFAEGIVETVQHPLLVLDRELRIKRATGAFYREFQVSEAETEGANIFSVGNEQWNIPQLRALLQDVLTRDVPFRDLDVEHEFPHIGRRTMRLNARRIVGGDNTPHTVLLAIEDVTERKEAAEIQYRRLFESAKDGMIVVDAASMEIIDVNPYFLDLTRYSRKQIQGKLFWEIPPIQKLPEARRVVAEALETGMSRFDAVRLETSDGAQLIVEIIANRYRVKDRMLIQANIRDVTERRRAEENLRRSNLDLQQFAFAASHDLQEPLRTLINQSQHLQKRYLGKLDADADEIIRYITSASDRMRHMVLDLLSYAQTARANISVVPTSIEGVLATAILNLQLAIHSVDGRITWDPLPTVLMDPTQLLQLLQNLIGNALKYHGAEAPRIHLSAKHVGNEWIVSVQDNGIGIESKSFDYIFTVFKRLHGSEYPGTGIGLATCKRIVERAGGRIWVESELGKGSTFFFTARDASPE